MSTPEFLIFSAVILACAISAALALLLISPSTRDIFLVKLSFFTNPVISSICSSSISMLVDILFTTGEIIFTFEEFILPIS